MSPAAAKQRYVRCSQGHVFNRLKHDACPTCGEKLRAAVPVQEDGGDVPAAIRGLPRWAIPAGAGGIVLVLAVIAILARPGPGPEPARPTPKAEVAATTETDAGRRPDGALAPSVPDPPRPEPQPPPAPAVVVPSPAPVAPDQRFRPDQDPFAPVRPGPVPGGDPVPSPGPRADVRPPVPQDPFAPARTTASVDPALIANWSSNRVAPNGTETEFALQIAASGESALSVTSKRDGAVIDSYRESGRFRASDGQWVWAPAGKPETRGTYKVIDPELWEMNGPLGTIQWVRRQ